MDDKPTPGDFSSIFGNIFEGIDLTPRTPEEQAAFIERIKNPSSEKQPMSLRDTLSKNFPMGTTEELAVSNEGFSDVVNKVKTH